MAKPKPFEIEVLSFIVRPPTSVEDFIKADEEVWGKWLQRQVGYLQKKHTTNPGGRVDLSIFWRSKQCRELAARSREIPHLENELRNKLGNTYHMFKHN
jgi:hypothetical protein